MNWSFTQLWNECVMSSNRPVTARDYCWASEMGGGMIDRYLRMTGVQPTTPPNIRSLRKFEAGNIFEWIVRFVLSRAGILRDFQDEVWFEREGLLKVKGKLDFIAGGIIDPERAKADVASLGLPESIQAASSYIVEKLAEKFGDEPLSLLVLEIKSCSTFAMDRMEVTNKPILKHELQCFHYVNGLGMEEGRVVYICKDDMRMMEFPVFSKGPSAARYIDDLKRITEHYNSGVRPLPEPLVMWDHDAGKFSKNLDVEYSPYLSMVYGYLTPRNYSDHVAPIISRWNRVLKRYADGEKITDKNADVKQEILASGYNFDELVYTMQQKGYREESNQ